MIKLKTKMWIREKVIHVCFSALGGTIGAMTYLYFIQGSCICFLRANLQF